MFTGIVEAMGKVASRKGLRLEVATPFPDLGAGESIAVNGVCVTVTSVAGGAFFADLSPETVRRSNLGRLSAGDEVNLERPLRAGGRLGGHFVQGHVDGVGWISRLEENGDSVEMWIEAPAVLGRYLVEKGSVAVEGVSLTVAALDGPAFAVALIPFTLQATTLGKRTKGDGVNIEVDMLAKYVERLLGREGDDGGIRNDR